MAGVLDVLASPATFRRLLIAWELDGAGAADAAAWVALLVAEAVAAGRGPA